jgi:peroxiredoxin
MKIEPGQAAPDFTLFDSEKNPVSLSDFRGKNVLLLFFPQAFTSVCTKEFCGIRDDIGRYSNAKAEVIAISVDSVFTLKKYKEDQQYNFTFLSDFNKEVSALYGSLIDEWILGMKGVSQRSAFIIDSSGIVRYADVLKSTGDMPDFEAINAQLEVLNG